MAKKKQELPYAEEMADELCEIVMAEIEKILARFRSDEMDVDSLAAEVRRATELIASCRERLRKAEEEVNKTLE